MPRYILRMCVCVCMCSIEMCKNTFYRNVQKYKGRDMKSEFYHILRS